MLLFFQSSGLCVQSPSIIPVPGYPLCLVPHLSHLLGKGWPLGSRLWCLLWVCHFPIGILGQVWYLIVSIPDLCNLITLTVDQKSLVLLPPSISLLQRFIHVWNRITVYSYGFLFSCTTVGQASDSMTALTKSFNRWVGAWCLSVAGPTVAQLEVFFSSDYLWVMSPFLSS